MKKRAAVFLVSVFLLLTVVVACNADSANLTAPESFTVQKEYDVVSIKYTGSNPDSLPDYEATVENTGVAKVGYTMYSPKKKLLDVSLVPVKPGTTKLKITNKKNKSDSISIRIIVPDPNKKEPVQPVTGDGGPFVPSRLSPYFENGSDNVESHVINGGAGEKFTIMFLIDDEGTKPEYILFAMVFDSSSETYPSYGYHFTVDGHKYSFTSTDGDDYIKLEDGTLLMVLRHEKMTEVITKMSTAKKIRIDLSTEFAGYNATVGFDLPQEDFEYMRSLCAALIRSNYLSSIVKFDGSPTVVFSEEDVE